MSTFRYTFEEDQHLATLCLWAALDTTDPMGADPGYWRHLAQEAPSHSDMAACLETADQLECGMGHRGGEVLP